MKKSFVLFLLLGLLTLACNEGEDAVTPTETFELVGAWNIASSEVTYLFNGITFTADGLAPLVPEELQALLISELPEGTGIEFRTDNTYTFTNPTNVEVFDEIGNYVYTEANSEIILNQGTSAEGIMYVTETSANSMSFETSFETSDAPGLTVQVAGTWRKQ